MVRQLVWVFNGANGRFPGGVFTSEVLAEKWIRTNQLTGVITKYPVDVGTFDWAREQGFLSEKVIKRTEPDFIGSFTSAGFDHFHFENGERA